MFYLIKYSIRNSLGKEEMETKRIVVEDTRMSKKKATERVEKILSPYMVLVSIISFRKVTEGYELKEPDIPSKWKSKRRKNPIKDVWKHHRN